MRDQPSKSVVPSPKSADPQSDRRVPMAIVTEIHPGRITGAAQRLETRKPMVPITYDTRHMADDYCTSGIKARRSPSWTRETGECRSNCSNAPVVCRSAKEPTREAHHGNGGGVAYAGRRHGSMQLHDHVPL